MSTMHQALLPHFTAGVDHVIEFVAWESIDSRAVLDVQRSILTNKGVDLRPALRSS
jgi:hypothetical protein